MAVDLAGPVDEVADERRPPRRRAVAAALAFRSLLTRVRARSWRECGCDGLDLGDGHVGQAHNLEHVMRVETALRDEDGRRVRLAPQLREVLLPVRRPRATVT